jgi:hypothetical protein
MIVQTERYSSKATNRQFKKFLFSEINHSNSEPQMIKASKRVMILYILSLRTKN